MVKLSDKEKEEMEATKYVVVDEHTLGYEIPETNTIGILHSSVVLLTNLKGGHLPSFGWIFKGQATKIRNATREDFEIFRVKVPPDFQEN